MGKRVCVPLLCGDTCIGSRWATAWRGYQELPCAYYGNRRRSTSPEPKPYVAYRTLLWTNGVRDACGHLESYFHPIHKRTLTHVTCKQVGAYVVLAKSYLTVRAFYQCTMACLAR